MPDSQKIVRYGREEMVQHEEFTDGSDIATGELLEETANGVAPHATAAESGARTLVAVDARDRGMEMGDTYVADELVRYMDASGGGVHLRLVTGESVSKGDDLVSAGDGSVRNIDTAGGDTADAIVASADEAVDNSGGSAPAYVAVDIQ